MKKILIILYSAFFILHSVVAQTYCDSTGNIAIFSNYDGGVLKINCDVNIPNLKIGIVSYENDSVMLSGAYVNNVTQVVYAGYFNSSNMHCSPWPTVKSINGAPAGTDTIIFMPAATQFNTNGWSDIICNYSCDTSTNQGGCNTADQIAEYFFSVFGSRNFLFHYTQYGCWTNTLNISDGGNCCATGLASLSADFSSSVTAVCGEANNCIDFYDNSTGNPTSWQWYFPGAVPNSSTQQNPTGICFSTPGNYFVSLVASNAGGSDSTTFSNYITVYPAPVAPTITQSIDTLFATQGYSSYQWYQDSLIISGATDYFYIVPQDGNYNLVVTDSNGCVVGAGVLNVVTSANSLSFGEGWGEAFPNPTTGKFEVKYYSDKISLVTFELINSIGDIIYREEKQMQQGMNTFSFSGSLSLSFGEGRGEALYLLKINSEGKISSKKIVIGK